MNILIIGQGGREHALAWKISQSPEVENIYIAPGNPGTAQEPKCKNITITVDDIPALLKFAQTHLIDLTIVGPELPLTLGIVDEFTQHGLKCFGATQAASQLESSKTFCKKFAEKYQIPTAKAASFTDIEKARYYAQNHPLPFVIKADGLAAGKGVVIIDNYSLKLIALVDIEYNALRFARNNDTRCLSYLVFGKFINTNKSICKIEYNLNPV